MDIMAEIIRRTMKRVDADMMTGEDCWNTMMTDFKDYKPYGYLSPMSFGPKMLIGPDSMYMFYLEAGELTILDKDVYTPDLLPGGRDVVK